jgi:hypothetical protein
MRRGVETAYRPPTVTHHGRVGEVTLSHTVVFGASLARAVASSLMGTTTPVGGGSTPGGDTVVQVPAGGNVPGGNTVTHTITNHVTNSPGSGASPAAGTGVGPGSGGGGNTAGAAGSGHKLPFTGFAVVYLAGAGAAMASTGAVLRRVVRRRGDHA